MSSLAELSKNEFTIEDITEMEMVLLKALNWNMSPPTASSFCDYFHALLPSCVKPSVRQTILQRSYFFCELSVMDYSFMVSESQSEVALGGILNSLAGLSASSFSEDDKQNLIENIEELTGMDHTSEHIKTVQLKLWGLYRHSSQYKVYDSKNMIDTTNIDENDEYQATGQLNESIEPVVPMRESTRGNLKGFNRSPVCIASPE